MTVDPGEDVTCTFENHEAGRPSRWCWVRWVATTPSRFASRTLTPTIIVRAARANIFELDDEQRESLLRSSPI